MKASLHLIQDSIDGTYPFYAALAPDWFPVMRFGKVKEAIDNFQNKTKALIEARRQSGEDAGDLLSMLLLAEDDEGKSMTTEQVVGQVASLLFAGHETTASGLSWLWYALARNPQVQDKLLAEIDTVLEGRRATFEDLPNLPYSRMVIDEMLRLYPPAWYTERTPREDVQFGEYLVPAGTPVVVTVIATHRDPRYFDDPLAFIPERFAPENRDNIQKFTYLPFGSGTHRCMGDNFALLEMQLIMITMLQHFTYAIPDGFEIEPRPIVTLGIEGGLPITVSAR
ncbi:MAG: cytochrome P450 [Chloroflexota bacterium]